VRESTIVTSSADQRGLFRNSVWARTAIPSSRRVERLNGHVRWTGFNLSMGEIVKTLVRQVGAPVVDATG